MNAWKIILGTMKIYGQEAVTKALVKALRHTSPARWGELAAECSTLETAAHSHNAEDFGATLSEVLFGIKP